MKRVLVIGSGGREHAIAWKLSLSQKVEKVFVAPGNPGMKSEKIEILNIVGSDFKSLIKFAKENNIYFTIVGPEVELSLGVVDAFEKEGLSIFGPNKYCAQLESSKDFCKSRMIDFDIPTAKHVTMSKYDEIIKHLKTQKFPIVLKADGLAAGKGVVIPQTFEEAESYLKEMIIDKKFGDAAKKIVIEEFLEGQEFSFLAFVNDDKIAYMQIAQDHKRAFDNDEGENTGGMGVYTPAKQFSKKEIKQGEIIIKKMVLGMKKQGHPYKGILYAGLISTKDGVKVIEFNARFGDPETEVVLKALESDLFDVIDKMLKQMKVKLKWSKKSFVGVVLASQGYPGDYQKGLPINLKKLNDEDSIFFMGVAEKEKKLVSAGGRVLIAIGEGKDFELAREKAYNTIKKIKDKNYFYRSDIGLKGQKK